MTFFNITPEFIEKAHRRYNNIIRHSTNKRIKVILKYAGYTVEDLAVLLEVDVETAKRYMKDFTKMPLKEIWLLGRACNVWLDCFPQMAFWHDTLINDMKIPESDKQR